jgi:hypothetical protein
MNNWRTQRKQSIRALMNNRTCVDNPPVVYFGLIYLFCEYIIKINVREFPILFGGINL